MNTYKLLILPLFAVLTGCGQPGPLYLPGQPPPIHVEPETRQNNDLSNEQNQ